MFSCKTYLLVVSSAYLAVFSLQNVIVIFIFIYRYLILCLYCISDLSVYSFRKCKLFYFLEIILYLFTCQVSNFALCTYYTLSNKEVIFRKFYVAQIFKNIVLVRNKDLLNIGSGTIWVNGMVNTTNLILFLKYIFVLQKL